MHVHVHLHMQYNILITIPIYLHALALKIGIENFSTLFTYVYLTCWPYICRRTIIHAKSSFDFHYPPRLSVWICDIPQHSLPIQEPYIIVQAYGGIHVHVCVDSSQTVLEHHRPFIYMYIYMYMYIRKPAGREKNPTCAAFQYGSVLEERPQRDKAGVGYELILIHTNFYSRLKTQMPAWCRWSWMPERPGACHEPRWQPRPSCWQHQTLESHHSRVVRGTTNQLHDNNWGEQSELRHASPEP